MTFSSESPQRPRTWRTSKMRFAITSRAIQTTMGLLPKLPKHEDSEGTWIGSKYTHAKTKPRVSLRGVGGRVGDRRFASERRDGRADRGRYRRAAGRPNCGAGDAGAAAADARVTDRAPEPRCAVATPLTDNRPPATAGARPGCHSRQGRPSEGSPCRRSNEFDDSWGHEAAAEAAVKVDVEAAMRPAKKKRWRRR
ncbi:Protein of unknown function [Gryllus bimaculatus]|nr:Protein of unknown function [Gryllus bimaculatus]